MPQKNGRSLNAALVGWARCSAPRLTGLPSFRVHWRERSRARDSGRPLLTVHFERLGVGSETLTYARKAPTDITRNAVRRVFRRRSMLETS